MAICFGGFERLIRARGDLKSLRTRQRQDRLLRIAVFNDVQSLIANISTWGRYSSGVRIVQSIGKYFDGHNHRNVAEDIELIIEPKDSPYQRPF